MRGGPRGSPRPRRRRRRRGRAARRRRPQPRRLLPLAPSRGGEALRAAPRPRVARRGLPRAGRGHRVRERPPTDGEPARRRRGRGAGAGGPRRDRAGPGEDPARGGALRRRLLRGQVRAQVGPDPDRGRVAVPALERAVPVGGLRPVHGPHRRGLRQRPGVRRRAGRAPRPSPCPPLDPGLGPRVRALLPAARAGSGGGEEDGRAAARRAVLVRQPGRGGAALPPAAAAEAALPGADPGAEGGAAPAPRWGGGGGAVGSRGAAAGPGGGRVRAGPGVRAVEHAAEQGAFPPARLGPGRSSGVPAGGGGGAHLAGPGELGGGPVGVPVRCRVPGAGPAGGVRGDGGGGAAGVPAAAAAAGVRRREDVAGGGGEPGRAGRGDGRVPELGQEPGGAAGEIRPAQDRSHAGPVHGRRRGHAARAVRVRGQLAGPARHGALPRLLRRRRRRLLRRSVPSRASPLGRAPPPPPQAPKPPPFPSHQLLQAPPFQSRLPLVTEPPPPPPVLRPSDLNRRVVLKGESAPRFRCIYFFTTVFQISLESGEMEEGGKKLGSRGIIDRAEFVRVIVQCLYSLGYRESAAALESESGVLLDSPVFDSLVPLIVSGRWEDCVDAIESWDCLTDSIRAASSYLVWRESFMELMNSAGGDDGALSRALSVLRQRISPLEVERRKVHKLARRLMVGESAGAVNDGLIRGRLAVLANLSELVPPWIRLSEPRLMRLVETAVVEQRATCIYHNSNEPISLYEDHKCSSDRIPSQTIQILREHTDEVWFVQFSNNGEFLASSSKDCTAMIWTVGEDDRVSLKHMLAGHIKPVSFLSWSPDDTMLITCGTEEVLRLWDVAAGTCRCTLNDPATRVISSFAWFPDSQKIVCGSSMPDNCILTCDLHGHELKLWKGDRLPKVSNLVVTPDGRRLISIASENLIRICDLDGGSELTIPEDHPITSLVLSPDGLHMIVNLNNEIHLWPVDSGPAAPPAKYTGHKQVKYVIRSCFGGAGSAFIASGSEDNMVYIWHRERCELVKVLQGHEMTVNSVSWNPKRPQMLASASDDRMIRIWMASTG
ncbi:uncharacterized protein LOC144700193 [Wolffia australiana]